MKVADEKNDNNRRIYERDGTERIRMKATNWHEKYRRSYVCDLTIQNKGH